MARIDYGTSFAEPKDFLVPRNNKIMVNKSTNQCHLEYGEKPHKVMK